MKFALDSSAYSCSFFLPSSLLLVKAKLNIIFSVLGLCVREREREKFHILELHLITIEVVWKAQ